MSAADPPWRSCRPFVVAELGVNHDGSLDKALALVEAAAKAGADAVKTQLFRPKALLSGQARLAAYQENAGERDPLAMLQRLALPPEAQLRIAQRARALGLRAIVTVFTPEDACALDADAWDAVKTASPDIVNKPLLEALAALGLPMIVSTGASEEEEVARALDLLAQRASPLALAALHCVSAYPTPDEWAFLGGVEALQAIVEAHAPRAAVGYSDHTRRTDTGAMAVALGAQLLEKHLTLRCDDPGPDHAASLEPDAFAAYVQAARRAAAGKPPAVDPVLYGQRAKRVLPVEEDVRRASRQSLVARQPLRAGEAVERSRLSTARPAAGIEPWAIDEVVGRRLRVDVEAGRLLQWEDLA